MSETAPPRSLVRRGLRLAGYGCATLVAVVLLGAAFVVWRVDRFMHAVDPEDVARNARLDASRVAVPGAAVDVALDGCDLYRTARGTSGWTAVALPFAPGQYPRFITACSRANAEVVDGLLYVSICAQAIGAGGGCGRAGTFRSRDATTWERHNAHPSSAKEPLWTRIDPDGAD